VTSGLMVKPSASSLSCSSTAAPPKERGGWAALFSLQPSWMISSSWDLVGSNSSTHSMPKANNMCVCVCREARRFKPLGDSVRKSIQTPQHIWCGCGSDCEKSTLQEKQRKAALHVNQTSYNNIHSFSTTYTHIDSRS